MRACLVGLLLSFAGTCLAQDQAAYPESEAAAAWRGLAASYVRQAIADKTLDRDAVWNARVDAVMARVGTAVGAIDARFARATWRVILIEDFGRGAAAFPGETILVDAKFVRALQLSDAELAMIFAHEAAHVVAGHAYTKLSFMAETLGKEKVPTARTALLEFLAKDSYGAAFLPTARLQEREADALGAAIFFASGYDLQQALGMFDKLAALEAGQERTSHDAAAERKQTIAGVIEELRRLHASRGASPR